MSDRPRYRPLSGSKTRRLAAARLERHFFHLRAENVLVSRLRDEVPDAWAFLEADVDVQEPKEKVTLYLDRSVARFFRAMGRGYQGRINRLLAIYAQAKIAEVRWWDEAMAREADETMRDKLQLVDEVKGVLDALRRGEKIVD